MTLSIKNGRYAFLIRLDLMFSMSLWKEFQLLQILNNLSNCNFYPNNFKFCAAKKNLKQTWNLEKWPHVVIFPKKTTHTDINKLKMSWSLI